MAFIELSDIMDVDDDLIRNSTTSLAGRSVAEIAILLASLSALELTSLGAAIKAVTQGWVPAGGGSGQLLRKTGAGDYALGWVDEQIAENIAIVDAGDHFDDNNVELALQQIGAQLGDAGRQTIFTYGSSRVVDSTNYNAFLVMTAASTVFLPGGDDSRGFRIDVCQAGAAQVKFAADTGLVTVNTPNGFTKNLRAQGAIASAICTADGVWRLVGDLEVAA